jgi:hypothetical protein
MDLDLAKKAKGCREFRFKNGIEIVWFGGCD